jgi:hypothetical protein
MTCLCSLSFNVGLDGSLKRLGVRANNLRYLLAVLEKEEGGHGADAEVLGNVGDFVHIELVEAGCRVGV